MFHISSGGTTLHLDAVGSKHKGAVMKFGETALFKHPASSTAHASGGRRVRKSKTTWEKGIFLGKTYESDEFLMGTALGVVLVRSVRRLPTQGQADKDLFSSFVGAPWGRKVGQTGRPRKAATVSVTPAVPATARPSGQGGKTDGTGGAQA